MNEADYEFTSEAVAEYYAHKLYTSSLGIRLSNACAEILRLRKIIAEENIAWRDARKDPPDHSRTVLGINMNVQHPAPVLVTHNERMGLWYRSIEPVKITHWAEIGLPKV